MTLSKLNRLAAKFAVAAEKLDDVDWDADYDAVRMMLRSLKLKWRIVGEWTRVIKVLDLDVILKRRSGLSDSEIPSSNHTPWMVKYIIPTASFYLPDTAAWVVQPVALRDNARKYKAYDYFTKECVDRNKIRAYDIHPGNVGWYKGKPVLIDW